MKARLELRAYGDAGLLAGVLAEDYESRWAATQSLATAVRRARPSWLVDVIATYDHLFVSFDPGCCDHDTVGAFLQRLTDTLNEAAGPGHQLEGRTFEVPVLFGGDAGPDLDVVAHECGLAPDDLIDRLTARPWKVRFVASPVGTPFTDRADWDLAVPRMAVPRVGVPPGSIALSGRQSIIYPVRSPGGWRLVGRTPVRLVDASGPPDELVPYRAGDHLVYAPIDHERFVELQAQGSRLGVAS